MVRFAEPLEPYLVQAGHVPLPPYIHASLQDPERYQTVYARQPGSAAAPTAGLHFTRALMESLQAQGVGFARPDAACRAGYLRAGDGRRPQPASHAYRVVPAHPRNCCPGQRHPPPGWAGDRRRYHQRAHPRERGPPGSAGDTVAPLEGPTDLYILPGYTFRAVDALMTNFHLPRSTLIMLVSAFAGRERLLAAYDLAVQQGYRFYSFGDAMLIL